MPKSKKSNGSPRLRLRVPNDVFVKAYKKAKSNDEVSTLTGLSYSGVLAKAKTLRDAGVKLPKLARPVHPSRIDVAGLNAILKD